MRLPEGASLKASVPPPAPVPMMITSNCRSLFMPATSLSVCHAMLNQQFGDKGHHHPVLLQAQSSTRVTCWSERNLMGVQGCVAASNQGARTGEDRKSTRLNSSQ